VNKLESLRKSASNFRKRVKGQALIGSGGGLIASGGLNYLRGRFPEAQELGGIDSRYIAGGLGLAYGLFGAGNGAVKTTALFMGVATLGSVINEETFIMGVNDAAAAPST
jgi:hypothetical protein